jgi:hypothetical protein
MIAAGRPTLRRVSEKRNEDELDFERAEFENPEQPSAPGEIASDDDTSGRDGSGKAALEESQNAPTAGPVDAACAACGAGIVDRYFRVNAQSLCPRCTALIQAQYEKGVPGAFVRATAFGLAGGVLGAALYYGVAWIANAEFGIVAIVVGILVGKGVRRGAGLHRHWLYPALGLGLTYLAIVSTYVPDVLNAMTTPEGVTEGAVAIDGAAQSSNVTLSALLLALLFALVVPVLMLVKLQIWGPIILAIGLWEGWRYGRAPKLVFEGPLRRSAS